MQNSSINKLYGTDNVIKWMKSKYPEEEIVFASAATILETKKAVPVGRSLQRIFQHRGVVIVTKNQIVLKSLFSLSTVFYLLLLLFSLATLWESKDWSYLFGIVFFGIAMATTLPYQRQIPLNKIREIELGSVKGITKTASLLTVYLENKSVNIVPADALNEDVINLISPNRK